MACIGSEDQIFTLSRILPFSYEKAHFIRDIVLFLYLTPVARIYPSKKEKDPYIAWLFRHLAGSEQHCLKILNYHTEKVKFKKKKQTNFSCAASP